VRAVFIREFGDPGVLDVRQVPEPPEPGGSLVLVRVRAAGLNRADLMQLRGLYPPPAGYSPNIPGLEFAGEVVAVGPAVTRWKVDDRAFAITAGEAQADYILSEESLLAAVPAGLNFADAAAVPEAFMTANDAIRTQGRLAPADTLLIHAVGSGVGLAGLQLGKATGATVVGTSRTADKLDRCREYGLDLGIEVGAPPQFAERVMEFSSGQGADVILDLAGGAYFAENLRAAARFARIMLVGLTAGAHTEFDMRVALYKRLSIIGTVLRTRSIEEKGRVTVEFADDVLPLLASGVIRPTVDHVFPVESAAEAYRYLSSNQSFGKVVLEF
jgi:NADPH:quinone reductase